MHIRMYITVLLFLQSFNLLKSESSENDSEEEHDIDILIHDNPMYTSLSSSHDDMDIKDHTIDIKVDDMFVAARGRFIVPTSTLPHIRHSMDLVKMSSFSFDSTPDSPTVDTALASIHFHLEYNSFEVSNNEEMESTRVCKEDGEIVMQLSLDDVSTSSLSSVPLKVSPCVYIYCIY